MLLTIAVLVLNNHVTIFYPRRIVADHVRVMPQHGVSIDFTQSQVPETRKQNERNTSQEKNLWFSFRTTLGGTQGLFLELLTQKRQLQIN